MASPSPSTEATAMKPATGKGWWARHTLRFKIILLAIIAVIVIGLAVGLGVGLTQGGGSGSSPSAPSSTPTGTLTPLPSPSARPKWQPSVNSTWQIILQGPINFGPSNTSITPNVSVYDIDLFTNSEDVISTLHNMGKNVICYFSAGSYEPGRPDSANFTASDKGDGLQGWPGEVWLNLNSTNVRNIMKARIELAAQKGCDAVDPDNVDGYQNTNGLGLTEADSVNYMQFLAENAQAHNLSIGLKNALDIIPAVLPVVQFSVNEQCVEYGECTSFAAFIAAGKPVFHIEYPSDAPNLKTADVTNYCSNTGKGNGTDGFSTVLKNMDLDGWVEYCDGQTADTPLLNTSS